jgi:hypothetical protein
MHWRLTDARRRGCPYASNEQPGALVPFSIRQRQRVLSKLANVPSETVWMGL